MELDEFVKSTLLQILNGVEAAQKEAQDSIINPTVNEQTRRPNVITKNVSFDVAVASEDKTNSEGKAKISVLGTSLGGGIDSEVLSKIATRIKFEVPVKYKQND